MGKEIVDFDLDNFERLAKMTVKLSLSISFVVIIRPRLIVK